MKKTLATVNIKGMAFPCIGVGEFNGESIFVKNSLPGQKLNVWVSKKKGKFWGTVEEVVEKSPLEVAPFCADFGSCGGCTFQNISYTDELTLKEAMLRELFSQVPTVNECFQGVIPTPSFTEYRNKMEYSFGDSEKGGVLALGMRKRNSYYEVVTSEKCEIVDNDFRQILTVVLEFFRASEENFYHKLRRVGSLRHLIIRKGHFTGEIMVNVVATTALITSLQPLVEKLINLKLIGKIVSIVNTLNDSVADVVLCDEMRVLYGEPFFHEKLLGLTFKIYPFSFFQTNSQGAETLYSVVRDFAGDCTGKTVFDLYCGTGTISQIIAGQAKSVVGIDIVEASIFAARENALLNGLSNCTFIAGDVLKLVDTLEEKPDLIIVDPPREGIHQKALGKIVDFGTKSIVYVSCNPVTLVRDLGIFMENAYSVRKVVGVDMFGRTGHVESVVLMSR